jgi:ferric-dicitrate binding protein FerR (iron transport regulator)
VADFYKDNLEGYLNESRLPFRIGKDEALVQIKSRIEMGRSAPVYHMSRRFSSLKVAAGIAVLLGAIAFFVFTLGVQSHQGIAGSKQEITLPDGSMIWLNGESHATYNKWLWKLSREVELEGEAFFDVKKGSSFMVEGHLGSVEVLGTSFLVNTSPDDFVVACKTGRVKVATKFGLSTVLNPGMLAKAQNEKLTTENIDLDKIATWNSEDYVFENIPANELFEILSDVTGHQFIIEAELGMTYSGQFSKTQPIEEVLSIVCLPMNLNFELSDNTIIITNK